jgi:gas vesicle protein
MRNESGMAGAGVGGLFLGIVIGAVAGGLAALLLAPRSGRETRQYIKERASDAQEMVQQRVQDVKNKFSQVKGSMQSRAEEEANSITK